MVPLCTHIVVYGNMPSEILHYLSIYSAQELSPRTLEFERTHTESEKVFVCAEIRTQFLRLEDRH